MSKSICTIPAYELTIAASMENPAFRGLLPLCVHLPSPHTYFVADFLSTVMDSRSARSFISASICSMMGVR